MNTTIHLANSPLENSGALVSALDDGMEHNESALMGTKISAGPQPTRKWSSKVANSSWADGWMVRGIPELDSPMAG